MKKLILAVIVISIGYFAIAKADETTTVTPKEFITTVASVPGKLGNHLSNEIAKTKKFQAENWAKMKADLVKLKNKFIKQ